VAAIAEGVASTVIGQVGGAYSVLVIRTIRGAVVGTVSGTMGKHFLEKIPAPNVEIFLSFAPPGFNDMGKDIPAIT